MVGLDTEHRDNGKNKKKVKNKYKKLAQRRQQNCKRFMTLPNLSLK